MPEGRFQMLGVLLLVPFCAATVGAEKYYFGLDLGRYSSVDTRTAKPWDLRRYGYWGSVYTNAPPLRCDAWFEGALTSEDPECESGLYWDQFAHAGGNRLNTGDGISVFAGHKGRFFRIEAEYFRRWRTGNLETRKRLGPPVTKYDTWFQVSTYGATSVKSQGLFLNVYHDFPDIRNMTPYVGVGQGLVRTEIDYLLVQQYRSSSEDLEYLGAIPEVASAMSLVVFDLKDLLQAGQLMAGLDCSVGDRFQVGIKLQLMASGNPKDTAVYRMYRGHEPTLNPDTGRKIRARLQFSSGGNRTGKITVGIKWKWR